MLKPTPFKSSVLVGTDPMPEKRAVIVSVVERLLDSYWLWIYQTDLTGVTQPRPLKTTSCKFGWCAVSLASPTAYAILPAWRDELNASMLARQALSK